MNKEKIIQILKESFNSVYCNSCKNDYDEDICDEINEIDNYEEKNYGVFRDKLFTPIDNNYAINIPLIYGEHIQLLLLNMNTGEIEQKLYDDIFNDE